jgi:uncharacterized lipoprotein YddW (UPF0748 family)
MASVSVRSLRPVPAVLALLGALLVAGSHPALTASSGVREVRALWVVRTTLTSEASVDAMVRAARDAGFNTLLVQVRGRGDAYYSGGLEPRPAALAGHTSFDPLAATIARARRAGLAVHAWVNVNLVANVAELPRAADHVVNRHPEWLMVPRELATELASLGARKPQYVQRLAHYVGSRAAEIEGLYLSPLTREAAEYTVRVIRGIAARYPVDGIHLDYARYPSDEFDYSREGLGAFRRSLVGDLPRVDVKRYDGRLGREPLVYSQAFPERWRAFRRGRLTELVVRIRQAVKEVRPGAVLSAAVFPDAVDAATRRLQDWPGWLSAGILDIVCPMAYTTDPSLFEAQLTTARTLAAPRPLWAGIGAYRLPQEQIVANIQTARRIGAVGTILFSYDSLTEPGRGPEYLSAIGRAAFTH